MADIEISHAEDYDVLTVDLGTAHTNEKIEMAGRAFSVLYTDGTGTVRFSAPQAAPIPLERISSLDFPGRPFKDFYLTNTAQTGKTAVLLIASELGLRVNPGALSVVQDILAGSVGVKGYDGTTWQAIRADAYKRLAVQDPPWWLRRFGGRPVLLDDAEGTLKWTQGAGTLTKDSAATFVHSGTSALKGVTAATAAASASAYWYGGRPKTTADRYVAFGCHFQLRGVANATPRDFELYLTIYDGTTRWWPRLVYEHYTTTALYKLRYYNSAGVYTDVPGGARQIQVTIPEWHSLELVLKRTATTWEYKKAVMDDLEYDLSGVGIVQTAVALPPHYYPIIEAITDAAAATTFYADDIWLLEDLPTAD